MIEKPDIQDEKIITALNKNYSVQVSHIEFLPIGNDASAWAYRVEAENQDSYFLKIRKDIFNPAGFLVPKFLRDHGIAQALAPLSTPTEEQELWINVEDFFLILYPFVDGKEAMEVGMSDSQWTEFGSTLKRIHTMPLTEDVLPFVPRESFIPPWGHLVTALHKQVNTQDYDDSYQKKLARLWKENKETIQIVVERTENIGKYLRQIDREFFLCHADIHTANILITPEQTMFIVDWEGVLLAPKERDLMFVVGSEEDDLFFEGYGSVQIDLLALAYYRYEWCVQEIGDYGRRVFLTKDTGESTKRDAVEQFMKLFSHGDVIDAALNTVVKI